MKVYYLRMEDCSGVFSTLEKAWESFLNCANRCGWDWELEAKEDDFFSVFVKYEDSYYQVYAVEYTLDEDNGDY